jgi:hypothetical protein
VDPPQRRDVDVTPRALDGHAVGRELLPALDRARDAHERPAVPDERDPDGALGPALVALLVAQPLDRAADRVVRPVDPRAEPRVAARVVAELVRDHAADAAF